MTLSIRALRHFSVLAEEGQYSKAARRLHLTQSALTRSIQSLEEALGLPIIDRAGFGISPTPEGLMVLERAHRILAETSALKREVDIVRGFESASVSFGVSPHAPVRFLSPLFVKLTKDHPGISVQVAVDGWRGLTRKLLAGSLDFVVALTPGPLSPELKCRQLKALHCGLFVRQGHPLLHKKDRLRKLDLQDFRVASSSLSEGDRDYLARMFGSPGAPDAIVALECSSVSALRDATIASDLILFSTREALACELRNERLVELQLGDEIRASLEYSVVSRARQSLTLAADQVVSLIAALVTELDPILLEK